MWILIFNVLQPVVCCVPFPCLTCSTFSMGLAFSLCVFLLINSCFSTGNVWLLHLFTLISLSILINIFGSDGLPCSDGGVPEHFTKRWNKKVHYDHINFENYVDWRQVISETQFLFTISSELDLPAGIYNRNLIRMYEHQSICSTENHTNAVVLHRFGCSIFNVELSHIWWSGWLVGSPGWAWVGVEWNGMRIKCLWKRRMYTCELWCSQPNINSLFIVLMKSSRAHLILLESIW